MNPKIPPLSPTTIGPLAISSKGVGYFRPFVAEDKKNDETWEVQKEFLKHAFPGDTVEVKKRPGLLYGRIQAEVVRVVSRTKIEFVGTVDKDPSGKNTAVFLIADDRRMYTDIVLDPKEAADIPAHTKVLVALDASDAENAWPDSDEYPHGKIVEVIGLAGENETEMQAIALEKGFRSAFPEHVEAEAHRIKKEESAPARMAEEIKNRRDMRDALTFTIDPADAKDFDDALSIKELGKKSGAHGSLEHYEIGVHIADVSYFVRLGTALDAEARKRALSVYLVDRTIPMLPEVLSNDLCSLNPHEDKYTFSAVFEIDTAGEIHSRWFGRTVIHSDKRFSYEDAQEILDRTDGKNSAGKQGELYSKELVTMRAIAKIFEKKKFEHGAIDFEADEVKFVLDPVTGKPLSVYRKQRKDTHRLIEEYMLLANREVAEYIFKAQNDGIGVDSPRVQSVYRIHNSPDRERIGDLATFLKALGYDLKNKDGLVTARDINVLLKQVTGKPEEELIKVATLRSMAKAVYSTKNIGHFGLGFEFYTHFTSPIRRYPDLMVHRFLERELKGGPVAQDEFAVYEKICIECSEREKQAANAERDSIKYKQVEYMQSHVGEEFDGIISGITEWGVYIEEKETKCEGMTKIKDIGAVFDDYFSFNPKTYSMQGEKTGKKITLGDSVRFKVISADLEKKLLDYQIVK